MSRRNHRLPVACLLANLFVLGFGAVSANAQGPSDIVWMVGGHAERVLSVAYSPDGQMLASGSDDDTIKLWRTSDGELLQTYDQETGTGVRSIQFSSDGRLFGYGRDDATVVLARTPMACIADCNGAGVVDTRDFICFLSAWAAGC